MLIITDGMENASTECTKDSIKALIKSKEVEGWTFAFLGANIDSFAVGGTMGMALCNIANYVQGNEGALFARLSRATAARSSAARFTGIRSAASMDFLAPEQQDAMAGEITRGLPPAQPSFRPFSPKPVAHSAKVESKPRNWRIATNK